MNETGSIKPVRKWNRFNKKLVLEPVYETRLPAPTIFMNERNLMNLMNDFQFVSIFQESSRASL